jgi:amino-acid N-acetyltransferase
MSGQVRGNLSLCFRTNFNMTTGVRHTVVRAAVADAAGICELVNTFARRGEMLPRTMSEVYQNLRDFYVVRDASGGVLACGALHILWEDLGEVKSLAVREELQGQGVGAQIVRACLDEAAELGLTTAFALTYRPGFFEKLGFTQGDVMTLPRKVWGECYRCPKFPGCNEIAMVRPVGAGGEA